MKKRLWLLVSLILLAHLFVLSRQAEAACRNPNLVLHRNPLSVPFVLASASGSVEIEWFGHAFFQLASSAGTRIITDPFGSMGYPWPEVWPHAVTVGRHAGNHNNVALAKGNPVILHGLKEWGREWNEIHTMVRDVLVYNVPIHTRAMHEFLRGTAFVFEMDGLCVLHTGDVGEPFNEDQLDLIGHVDIMLVPIGGTYTMGPDNAKTVTEQLKPKIVVPMHYYNNTDVLARFIDGPYRVRYLETNKFRVSKDTLPPVTEIYIPQVIWHGREGYWDRYGDRYGDDYRGSNY